VAGSIIDRNTFNPQNEREIETCEEMKVKFFWVLKKRHPRGKSSSPVNTSKYKTSSRLQQSKVVSPQMKTQNSTFNTSPSPTLKVWPKGFGLSRYAIQASTHSSPNRQTDLLCGVAL